MNGEEIPVDHGFPLRAIVPGHYGMASVKWLTHIRVLTAPFKGYWQTTDYGYWAYDENNNPMRLALGRMAVKSAIARPRTREFIPAVLRTAYSVRHGEATHTSKRSNSPRTTARPGSQRASWMNLSLARGGGGIEWQVPQEKETYLFKSRATDTEGNTQP